MEHSELDNRFDVFKKEKLLLRLLLIYCIGVSLCRLPGGSMRYIADVDWAIYRQNLIVRLPYYLVPFIALVWLHWKQFSRAGLFFTAGFSVFGTFNHAKAAFTSIRYRLPFFQPNPYLPQVRMNVLTATGLAVVFAFMSFYIFWLSKRLYAVKDKNHSGKIPYPLKVTGALILLWFCHMVPFMEYKGIVDWVAALFGPRYEFVEVHNAGSRIRYITASPDGKLLAIGADKGLSVWDAASQQCVWSDDVLRKVHRVRFSPSGKYLAAGGRGVPEGSSDIAVYEVDGFKRVPGIEMIEEDLTKEKIFHDLAFRPDEKSLLMAWHKEWDWEQIPGGYNGKEAKAIQDRESIITPKGMYRWVMDLVCTELSVQNGKVKQTKTIKTLSEQYDLLLSGGIGFSPSASYLLYPYCYGRGNLMMRNRFYLVDTQTWEEERIMLDDKYSMYVGVMGGGRDTDWYDWKFTKDEKDIYLLAEESIGMNTIAHMLLKLNLETQQTQEIIKMPTIGRGLSPWIRVVLTPDEKKAFLLGFGETYEKYGGVQERMISLCGLDLETKETKQFVYKHGGKQNRNGGWQITLLYNGFVAINFREQKEFIFVNIREENV